MGRGPEIRSALLPDVGVGGGRTTSGPGREGGSRQVGSGVALRALGPNEYSPLTGVPTLGYRNGTQPVARDGAPNVATVDMTYQRELLKGSTDSLLLALLVEQPMYGYQLVKELEQRSNGYFQFREGTLYPALHRLEKEGLLQGEWQPSPNGQKRRYYYVTDRGRMELASRLSQWRGFSRAVAMVLAPHQA